MSKARKGKPRPSQQGERHSRAKMTEAKVIEARELYATGAWTYRKLSMRFNISDRSMSCIINHKAWKHIKKGY